ncbi:hypothetical protein DB88DRAFT_473497 [Papiliotrema laurentii]|uniref:Uncharacterized protein n=1 Tax=Papiliotrema laurentii TaxID=5418 RepID=A0AAD9FQN0_PAPLA|nr:hypothetical protein DB88DRAFT_473497 [Papiliotrema laurentii]
MDLAFQPLRRVVTSHRLTDTGGTEVSVSSTAIEVDTLPGGQTGMNPVFATTGLPVCLPQPTQGDDALQQLRDTRSIVLTNGVNGRIVEMKPGSVFPMHRTHSIDYNILLGGSVYLITPTPDGEQKTLVRAGEVVIQQGTMHAWEAGPEGARWFSVVLHAKYKVNGLELPEIDL